MRWSIPLLFAVAAVILIDPRCILAASTEETFAQIKPSLATIVADNSVGTAFCIYSDDNYSYYLTNAHVVEGSKTVALYRHDPVKQVVKATLVAVGSSKNGPDLAVVRARVGNVRALTFSTAVPVEGANIATAGYPSAQYRLYGLSGELVPAFHVGIVSAIVEHGRIIEYDAQTLPGNSGGPLIDPSDGEVVGVVQAKIRESSDANLAIGIPQTVLPFLSNHGIAYQQVQSVNDTAHVTTPRSGAGTPGAVQANLGRKVSPRPSGSASVAALQDNVQVAIVGRWEGTDFRSSYDGSVTKQDFKASFTFDHKVYLSSGITSVWTYDGNDFKFEQADAYVQPHQSPYWRGELSADRMVLTLHDPSDTTVVMHRSNMGSSR